MVSHQQIIAEPDLKKVRLRLSKHHRKLWGGLFKKVDDILTASISLEEAYHQIKMLLHESKDSALLYYICGRLAHRFGDLGLAKSHLTHAIHHSANHKELQQLVIISLMNLLYGCNHTTELRALIKWRIEMGDGYEVYFMLGHLEEEAKSFNLAIKSYQIALQSNPSAHSCRLVLAKLFCHQGEFNQASRELKKLQQTYRQSEIVWALSALVQLSRKQEKLALSMLKKALRINPRCSFAYRLLGDYYFKSNLKKALNYYSKSIAGDKPSYIIYERLAQIYQKWGRYDEALAQLSLYRCFVNPDEQLVVQERMKQLNKLKKEKPNRSILQTWLIKLLNR